MPVDTSFYPKPNPQGANPLQTLGSVAQTANMLNQNSLFQQQFQSNVAAGQAARAAIDPQTGQLDTAKFANALANSPAAYQTPQFLQQAQQMQAGQIGIDKDRLDKLKDSLGITNNVLTSLLSKKNPDGSLAATKQDAIGSISTLLNSGAFGDPNSQEARAQAVQLAISAPDNPQGLQQWLTEHMIQNLDSQAKIQALYGNPQFVNTGQQQIPVTASPLGGVHQIGAPIQNELPPSTLTVIPGSNQQAYVGATGGAPGAAPALGTGRYPGAPAAAQAAPAASPGGMVPAAAPPGFNAAADVTARGSAQELADLRTDVQGSGARIFQLNKALSGLSNSPTGPGTQSVNDVKSFLLAQSPDWLKKIGLSPDANEIKNYDEANKYLTAFASSQAGAMGAGTDSKLATALSANASTHISNLAAKDVVKANIGLERMKQAQAAAWDSSPDAGNPQTFGSWATQWNNGADPRAFVVDLMSPKERADMIKDMKPGEQAKFLSTLRAAINTGVVTLSDLAPVNGAQ